MKRFFNAKLLTVAGIILVAAVSRFLPHPPNVTPLMAMAIFGGAMISDKKIAFILPLAAMFLSDIFLGFHAGMPGVYLGFILSVLIGRIFLAKPNALKVFSGSLAASVIFFVLSNLSLWMFGSWYEASFAGLITCFDMAIPFFRYEAVGTLAFSAVFFGAYALAERKIPALASSK